MQSQIVSLVLDDTLVLAAVLILTVFSPGRAFGRLCWDATSPRSACGPLSILPSGGDEGGDGGRDGDVESRNLGIRRSNKKSSSSMGSTRALLLPLRYSNYHFARGQQQQRNRTRSIGGGGGGGPGHKRSISKPLAYYPGAGSAPYTPASASSYAGTPWTAEFGKDFASQQQSPVLVGVSPLTSPKNQPVYQRAPYELSPTQVPVVVVPSAVAMAMGESGGGVSYGPGQGPGSPFITGGLGGGATMASSTQGGGTLGAVSTAVAAERRWRRKDVPAAGGSGSEQQPQQQQWGVGGGSGSKGGVEMVDPDVIWR